MNKLLSYLFFFFTVICFSQNGGFGFEFKYHPNSEYSSKFKKSTKLKTEKKVDKETKKYFDSVGVKRFQKGHKRESYKIITTTKEKKENQSIPVDIYISNFNYRGTFNKKNITKNPDTKILNARGHTDLENNITIDELLVDNSDKKEELREIIENREVAIEFPKHKIDIGDTVKFDHTVYYAAPLLAENLYNSNCIATLIKVKKGIAYFKVSTDQISEQNDYELVVKGYFKFDIERNFVSSVSLKSELFINEVIDVEFIVKHNYSEKINIRTEMKSTSR
jgi:hypothetical protein